jgi:hypothetical protein
MVNPSLPARSANALAIEARPGGASRPAKRRAELADIDGVLAEPAIAKI